MAAKPRSSSNLNLVRAWCYAPLLALETTTPVGYLQVYKERNGMTHSKYNHSASCHWW